MNKISKKYKCLNFVSISRKTSLSTFQNDPAPKFLFKKFLTGFTLLEILLVVGIISILAGIVIVAINPGRQLAQVRNTERQSDLKQIYNALNQYYIDYSTYPTTIPTTLTEICDTGTGTTTHSIDCTDLIDLSILVPTYLVSIPKDPQGSTLSLIPQALATTNGTGYHIMLNPAQKVVLVGVQAEYGVLVAIGTTTMPVAEAPSLIPTDGLIHYWSLDGNTLDSVGDRNGVAYGDATTTIGVKGLANTAYAFDGNGDYIRVPNIMPLGKTSVFSISTWVKFNSFTGSSFIVGQSDYPAGYNQFVWRISRDETNLSFSTCKQTVVCYSINYSLSNIIIGDYYHMVGVYDNADIKFYVNGGLIGSSTYTNTTSATSTMDFMIGGTLDWGSPKYYTNGAIDQIRFYNRAITPEEISAIYNEEKP